MCTYICPIMQDRARKEVENQANRLGLQKPVVAEATTILEHVYAKLVTSGSHHLDVMAAASVYVAVRMNKHPFSLLEIVTRTGRPLHKVGSAYTSALEVLGYTPPPVDYFRFIQRHSQGLLQPMQKYSKQVHCHNAFGGIHVPLHTFKVPSCLVARFLRCLTSVTTSLWW